MKANIWILIGTVVFGILAQSTAASAQQEHWMKGIWHLSFEVPDLQGTLSIGVRPQTGKVFGIGGTLYPSGGGQEQLHSTAVFSSSDGLQFDFYTTRIERTILPNGQLRLSQVEAHRGRMTLEGNGSGMQGRVDFVGLGSEGVWLTRSP